MTFLPCQSVFIAGTSTGVGKTWVTGLLGRVWLEQGHRVVTQKWVQTGHPESDCKTHQDVMHYSFPPQLEKDRCPYRFDFPGSPHLASKLENTVIQKENIVNSFFRLSKQYDAVIVEGSGGVLVPYSDQRFLIDIADELQLPLFLVATNSLGSINHTLLTLEALEYRHHTVKGIVFTQTEPCLDPHIIEDTPEIVGRFSRVPILGTLDYSLDSEWLYTRFKTMLLSAS